MTPLLVFAGPRALPTAATASAYYTEGGIAATIVRPQKCAVDDHRFPHDTDFIDDEAFPGVGEIKDFLLENSDNLAQFNRTPGWFLQQFIKLAAVAAWDDDLVFVADGDTIFSHALLDRVLREPVILATGETFANYDRLLRRWGLNPPLLSCVANGNVFPKAPILQELATPGGFRAMLEDHVLPSKGDLDFSEYQVAGSLLEPKFGSLRIRMFRRFDLLIDDITEVPLTSVKSALRRYDAVAIEANHHRSMAKRVAARAFYAIGRSW